MSEDIPECPGCEENENHFCDGCEQYICEGCFCHEIHKKDFIETWDLNPKCWEELVQVPHPKYGGEFYFKNCFPSKLFLGDENIAKVVMWMKLCEELGIV